MWKTRSAVYTRRLHGSVLLIHYCERGWLVEKRCTSAETRLPYRKRNRNTIAQAAPPSRASRARVRPPESLAWLAAGRSGPPPSFSFKVAPAIVAGASRPELLARSASRPVLVREQPRSAARAQRPARAGALPPVHEPPTPPRRSSAVARASRAAEDVIVILPPIHPAVGKRDRALLGSARPRAVHALGWRGGRKSGREREPLPLPGPPWPAPPCPACLALAARVACGDA